MLLNTNGSSTSAWMATAERSWDCPCHGSRFDVDGKVLHGPAARALEKVERGVEAGLPGSAGRPQERRPPG